MEINNNISEEEFNSIEAYLEGTLSKEKHQEFEALLQSDPELQSKLNWVKEMQEGIETAVFREQLEHFHTQVIDEDSNIDIPKIKKRFNRNFGYSIAAALLIGLGVIWFLKPNSNQLVFNKYYTPDPGLPTVMGSEGAFNFYDGMVDYKRGAYQIAIAKWQKLLEQEQQNDTLQYFIGMAYMASEEDRRAIPYLDKVSNNNFSVFSKDAKYYKALYLIKMGEITTASEILTSLKEMPRAQEVLKEIQKND